MVMAALNNAMGNINTACNNIRENLPDDSMQSVKKSFAFSFTAVALISGGNIFAASVLGTVAATVSLIDSVATSIIRQIRPEKHHFEWYENYVKIMVCVSVVNLLVAPFFGSFIVNVVASAIFILVSDIAKERLLQQVPLNESQAIMLV